MGRVGNNTWRGRASFALALALLLPLLLAARADAAAGIRDSLFGDGGFTILDEPGFMNEQLLDVVVLPNGKILGAGGRGESRGFLLVRLNPDGTPDTGFGNDGIGIDPDNGATGDPRSIAGIELLPDGSVVAAGLGRGAAKNAFEFARYGAGNSLDPGFGTGGLSLVEIAPAGGSAKAVAAAPEGKVVAVGDNGVNDRAVVVRVTAKGEPDAAFNAVPAGIRLVDVPGSLSEEAQAVDVLDNGSVLAAGASEAGGFIAKLSAAGAPSIGFGTGGIAIDRLGGAAGTFGAIYDVKALPDGRILAAGGSNLGGEDLQLAVARFTADGKLDPSFASGGIFTANPSVGRDEAFAIEPLADGRVLVAGSREDVGPETGDTWLLRLNADGRLDLTFGKEGQTIASAVPGNDAAYGLAVQPDGRAVIAGAASTGGGHRLLVGRFTADDPPAIPISGSPQPATVRCGGKRATIVGTAKGDRIKGTKRADVIAGLGGRDRIDGAAGNDTICGGAGKDVLKGGPGRDRLLGEAGADKLLGGPGRDSCVGGPGREKAAPACEKLKSVP